MGMPKECTSAGVALVIGIRLRAQGVRNDLAMTGEITILGKVLSVGVSSKKFLRRT
jgi:ATP-dependent Lon protease